MLANKKMTKGEKEMEIINVSTMPGDNTRICSSDALQPPHYTDGGGRCFICFDSEESCPLVD